MDACVENNVLQEGRIYTREGKMVASVTQEGLIRYHGTQK
jgi:acyl-CoA thioesterase